MDANFDISDFDYTYFRATVGRDDFGNTENRVRFYVLADGRQIALSNEMAPGQSQLITATVPANASILTLRAVTTEGISGNAATGSSRYFCRSESSLNKNEKSEFSASSATAVNSRIISRRDFRPHRDFHSFRSTPPLREKKRLLFINTPIPSTARFRQHRFIKTTNWLFLAARLKWCSIRLHSPGNISLWFTTA